MKFQALAPSAKAERDKRHRTERDGRIRDRMKAVLLKRDGWTDSQIAQALRIHEETARQHINDWLYDETLKPEKGGSNVTAKARTPYHNL